MTHDVIIIGGGIVGLATALQLTRLRPGLKVLVLEKEADIARHQTGHNSGVIHSGLYYKPGSLKATNCLRGYKMLLDFVQQNGIRHDLCGKIVVATRPEELPLLENLHQRGLQHGLSDIRKIDADELRHHEPHVSGLRGLWVPYTGIIDYTEVSRKYLQLFQQAGGEIRLGHAVTGLMTGQNVALVQTRPETFEARLVINCAGLYADKIAQMAQPEPLDVRILPFRGEYFQLRPERQGLVRNLIYPIPDPNFPFLGVHFTRMIGGGVEAGPNAVLAFRREGYRKTDLSARESLETLQWPGFRKVAARYWQTGLGEFYRSFSKTAFTKALQALIPDLQEADLVPGGAGVRAQACDRDGGLLDDFCIRERPRLINVLNAPSPAATSSLSIGLTVAEAAIARF